VNFTAASLDSNWEKVKCVIPCNTKGDRSPVDWRKYVISLFLDEKKGTKNYYYAYEVEKMTDGSAIYLLRPTWKWGLDYYVVIKHSNGKVDGPKFEILEKDLQQKKRSHPKLYGSLHNALNDVHAGKDPMRVLASHAELTKFNSVGQPVENVLKIAKWLFIDEDIKYWAYKGRDKWKGSLDELAANGSID
jgi:hypothetical protein